MYDDLLFTHIAFNDVDVPLIIDASHTFMEQFSSTSDRNLHSFSHSLKFFAQIISTHTQKLYMLEIQNFHVTICSRNVN